MTPISLDHRDILGDTIEKIAKEKAGIIKKGVPLISANQVSNVSKILEKRVKEKESVMHICPNPESVKLSSDGTSFEVNGNNFNTSLIGKHQAQNATLAIATINLFNSDIPVSYTHLRAHETLMNLVCRLLLEKKKGCLLYTSPSPRDVEEYRMPFSA